MLGRALPARRVGRRSAPRRCDKWSGFSGFLYDTGALAGPTASRSPRGRTSRPGSPTSTWRAVTEPRTVRRRSSPSTGGGWAGSQRGRPAARPAGDPRRGPGACSGSAASPPSCCPRARRRGSSPGSGRHRLRRAPAGVALAAAGAGAGLGRPASDLGQHRADAAGHRGRVRGVARRGLGDRGRRRLLAVAAARADPAAGGVADAADHRHRPAVDHLVRVRAAAQGAW